MPLLEITASKKITAIVALEDSTAKQIDQYATFTKGSADDVVNAALEYVFGKDKDFQRYREENANATPSQLAERMPLSTRRTSRPMR
jgi:hypothetical protein